MCSAAADLVFQDISWADVPHTLMSRFLELLRDMALLNPNFVDVIVRCCVRHLSPEIQFEQQDNKVVAKAIWSPEEQQAFFGMAFDTLCFVVERIAP